MNLRSTEIDSGYFRKSPHQRDTHGRSMGVLQNLATKLMLQALKVGWKKHRHE